MTTPAYLLQQARGRFEILLINDDAKLEGYLADSLEFYALHAGVVVRRTLTQPEITISPPPLSWNGCYNRLGEWVLTDHNKVTDTLFVRDDPTHSPWTLSYFVNLRYWDKDTALPTDIEYTLVIDHLETLIGEANSQKLALSKWVAQMDSMEIKSASEYQQQRQQIEQQIRMQASLPDFALL